MELDIVGRNEQCERHYIRIGGFFRSYLCVAEITLGGGEEVIVDLHIHRLQRCHTDFCRRIQSKSRRMGICADETSCTKLDPAEVADDGDGGICDAACLDRLEDGAARRSARLAVITRTLAVGAYAEHHCVGDMACLIVFLLNALQPYAHRFLILCVDDVREKARALNLVQNRGDTVRRYLPCEGRIGFHRHLFLRLK